MAIINGTDAADTLNGGAEDDTITARAGADLLTGGGGNDLLIANVLAANDHDQNDGDGDQLFGDAGNDRLLLSGGDVGNGGEGNDLLDALDADNGEGARLSGSFGNDTLIPTNGDDLVSGGAGVDDVNYGHAFQPVTVDLALRTQDTGGGGVDTIIGIENLTGGNSDDRLFGNDGANVLRGDPTIDPGAPVGDDLLDGRGGRDTASYRGAEGAVTVDLRITGAQNTGSSGRDTLVSIENLFGTTFGDTLIGNSSANRLLGGAGDDVLNGAVGDDDLQGGDGDDRMFGVAGDDDMTGGAGVDRMSGGDGRDFMFGGTEGDLLIGGAGVDALRGDAGEDRLYGDDGADNLRGGDGIDRMSGGAGNDTLVGGTGRDLLVGGLGRDQFQFVDGDLGSTFATADRIADIGAGEVIDLSRMDANTGGPGNQAFVWIGTQAFSGIAGQFRNIDGLLFIGDTDGDRDADIMLVADGAERGDFLL